MSLEISLSSAAAQTIIAYVAGALQSPGGKKVDKNVRAHEAIKECLILTMVLFDGNAVTIYDEARYCMARAPPPPFAVDGSSVAAFLRSADHLNLSLSEGGAASALVSGSTPAAPATFTIQVERKVCAWADFV